MGVFTPAQTPPSSTLAPTVPMSSSMDILRAELAKEEEDNLKIQLESARFKRLKSTIDLRELKDRPSVGPMIDVTNLIDNTTPSGKFNSTHPITPPSITSHNIHHLNVGHNISLGLPLMPYEPMLPHASEILNASISRFCEFPATQAIAATLHLSSKLKEDARKGKFVPVANFLPAQQPEPPTSTTIPKPTVRFGYSQKRWNQ